jgi:hypothetical protein
MRLLNRQLHGITATQSATRGWKECVCGKSNGGSYQTVGSLRLEVSGGNPEFYFSTLQEETVTHNNGADIRWIGFAHGWRVQSNGNIDNPTGNGAANFVVYQMEFNAGSTDWSYWDVGNRTITWRASSAAGVSTTIHRVMVYSERIDLITLYCV